MKFILSILFLITFSFGCAQNSTGGYTWGATYSPAWYASVPKHEMKAHFDKKTVYQLCNLWDENYPEGKNMWRETREQISQALIRKGEDSLKCRNPTADASKVSEKKMEKKINCTARRTEWRTMCSTGDYISVNGVSCYGTWYDSLHC